MVAFVAVEARNNASSKRSYSYALLLIDSISMSIKEERCLCCIRVCVCMFDQGASYLDTEKASWLLMVIQSVLLAALLNDGFKCLFLQQTVSIQTMRGMMFVYDEFGSGQDFWYYWDHCLTLPYSQGGQKWLRSFLLVPIRKSFKEPLLTISF